MIKNRVSIGVLVVFLISVMIFSVPAQAYEPAASSFQLGKLQDRPSWAGGSGGPNGGDGDDDTTTTYVLNIEIDYIEGHDPTQEALDYIVGYYEERGITVTFFVDDVVPNDESYSNGINDDEFTTIEDTYNDHDNGYYDNWKWVLFGTTVEDNPITEDDESALVMGYCWVVIKGKDVVTGNYIFIADEAADNWVETVTVPAIGAEVTVLMHEMGHSIGIGKVVRLMGSVFEIYDSDSTSVMSYLSEDNVGLDGQWHYSDDYWSTRNMKYYEEIVV